MRTTRDRIRHAISFEIIGILLVVPLGSLTFGIGALDVGVVTIAGATIATLWNYIYNVLFDRAMLRIRGHVHKTIALRMLHAVLFEGGLLVFTLPVMALYLGVGLWQALMLDLAFVVFYLVYAFVFNLAYDKLFPIPDPVID
ncbi:PACE efflux transporter [Aliiroseovarius sediminis]|uniref:PACE efflux transporter n=1 Tax=Aliiroseovarius sediminis TaxID=2925839 RepID=UPI001F59B8FE|nr:PACE efflux transporter [Aliiroseovarius sediminis]MCI2393456.1 PACE efflux transporter [Aliiroseovarius sediminis]